MRNPHLGQKVRADGVDGTFIVVKTNTSQGLADLESTDGTRKIRMHLPFSAIHPLGEGLIRADHKERKSIGKAARKEARG
jgi:hypothetical protein